MGRAAQSSRSGRPSPPRPELSRRQVFRAVGAAALAWSTAACGVLESPSDAAPGASDGTSAGTGLETTEPVGADVSLVVAAIADEEALADLCRSATQARPSLAQRLDPQLRLQREQIGALRGALTEQAPEPTGALPPVPHPAPSLDTVRREVTEAAHRRRDDCLAAESGLLARLMGSIAASHAVWVESIGPA